MKKLLSIFFILSFLFSIFAQQSVSKYGGRRILSDSKRYFTLIGAKSQKSKSDSGFLIITAYFNDIIDSSSVAARNIFINNRPLPDETRFFFSKKGQSVSFIIKDAGKPFFLQFSEIKNLEGKIMNKIRLNNFNESTFWQYSREEKAWQKS